MKKYYFHNTVLLKEAIKALKIKKNGFYFDCTFGHGGHSKYILSKLNSDGKLYAIDRDLSSIFIAKKILDKRFKIIHDNFSNLKYYAKKFNLIGKVNGILFDFGFSTLQIENAKRGFSFINDGPLDMRMNQSLGISAKDFLLKSNQKNLESILKKFGEEKYAKKIAKILFIKNKKKPITRTKQLADIVSKIIRRKNIHPATKTFQAIRIYINNELCEINEVLKNITEILSPKGRLVTISFHSLEDRIIKKFIRKKSDIPFFLKQVPLKDEEIKKIFTCQLKYIGKIFPTQYEIKNNPRARSAILRIAEKVS